MTAREVVERARKLVRDGKLPEAEALLLEWGYGDRLDAGVQNEYARLFPLRPEVKARLDGYAGPLANGDATVRLKAAKALARQACGVPTVDRESWLRTPHTTELINRFLAAETDPLVREHLVIALAEIARRYFRDGRTYTVVAPHIQSGRWNTRRWAAQALLEVGGERSFPDVLPLLGDEDDRVRYQVLGGLDALLERGPVSPAAGAVLRASLLSAAPGGDADFRSRIAQLLVLVPSPDVVAELTVWLKREKSPGVRKFVQMALAGCNRSGDEPS